MRRPLPLLVLALSVPGAVAHAQKAGAADPVQSPSGAETQPPTAGEPSEQPAPRQGTLRLTPERVGPDGAVLAGRRWRVRGTVRPWVAGQRVVVRFYRGERKLRAVSVAVRRVGTDDRGTFLVGFRTSRPGAITVRAAHARTPELDTLVATPRRVEVLPRYARPGSRGQAVRVLQHRLRRLGYVVGRPGLYDARTARAVLAFRKVTGMARTTVATRAVFSRLARGGGRFRVRYPSHGRHLEADLSRQVIALIDGRRVLRIYPTSSGAPATPTVLGSFRVYRKEPGTNSLGMVHSTYFIRGYAVHGYRSVPTYPASHGCLRVPIPDAYSIFRWLRKGTRVDVYR